MIEEIKDLFVVREDCYANGFMKSGRKTFVCVKEVLTDQLLQSHLELKSSLGTYNLNKDSKVKWCCFDFDKNTEEDFANAKKLYDHLKKEGINPLAELSGGGEYKIHIWVFTK